MKNPLRVCLFGGLFACLSAAAASGQHPVGGAFTLRNWGANPALENLTSADGVLMAVASMMYPFRSLDSGKSWHPFHLPEDGAALPFRGQIRFDPTAGLLYGTHFAYTYAAAPRAAGWTRLFEGGPFFWSSDGATWASNGWPAEGINVSRDGGRTWKVTDRFQMDGGGGTPLAAGTCVYVGSGDARISITCDGGVTWRSPLNDTLSNAARHMIRQEGAVIILGRHGLARSVDSGKTWTRWQGNLAADAELLELYHSGNSLFARAATAVHRSVDGGRSWGALAPPDSSRNHPPYGQEVADVEGALFTFTWQGLRTSLDGGRNWQPVRFRSIRTRIQSLIAQGNRILAHAEEGIMLSRDSGNTWDPSLPALANQPWTALAGSASLHAVGSQDGKVRISADAGAAWSRPYPLPAPAPVGGLAILRGSVLALSAGRLWRLSTPDSAWAPSPLPVDDSLRLLAGGPDALLLTATSHLWEMRPEGTLVDRSAGIAIGQVRGTWILDQRLFAYTSEGFLYQWSPGESMWSRLPTYFSRHVISLAGKGDLLVAATYLETWLTEDGGKSWSRISGTALSALAFDDGVLHAAAEDGSIWWSRLTSPGTSIASPGSKQAILRGRPAPLGNLMERNRRLDGRWFKP